MPKSITSWNRKKTGKYMENLEIRPMTEGDVEAVSKLEEAAFSMPWSEEAFRGMLADDNAVYLVADAGGRIVGVCGLHQSFEDGEITNVSVLEELRGCGIGRRLMEKILFLAGKRGITKILLEVRVSNVAAISLYENHGFLIIGRRKDFYEKPWEDAYVMQCLLKDDGEEKVPSRMC